MLDMDPRARYRSTTVPALVAAGLALGLLVPGMLLSWNASAAAEDELHFCHVPGSGTVYRVNGPGLRDDCSAPSHTRFTIGTALGEGAVTAPTLAPFETRAAAGEVNAGATNRVTASCEEGERLIFGGGSVGSVIEAPSLAPDISIIRMGRSTDPSAPPESWDVVASNRGTTVQPIRAEAYCMTG